MKCTNVVNTIVLLMGLSMNSGCLSREYFNKQSQEKMAEISSKTSKNASRNCCLFTYESKDGCCTFVLPKRVSDLLENAVIHDKKIHKREPIPLVRTPLGIFSIRGQKYTWPGYACVSPLDNEDYEISLPRCFNIPEDDHLKAIDSYNNPSESDRIFRDFFEKM